ncbi:uncharacterized protein LOC110012002 [Sesamum indicum]|uniref:Uncharacterized protein LOC110012002 n=1 Tax=Sesamum indicum TaxID=4182 RepID=A0A8M8V0G7_SESIN|nr:uncharacterized protein LOC110012002 [Sesamum indicum]
MSSILSSQAMVLATAMAVSGTVILLAFRLQKSPSTPHFPLLSQPLPPSCIISSEEGKRKEKKKKRVHFAEDVVDPIGNSDEYRKLRSCSSHAIATNNPNFIKYSNTKKGGKVEEMPANRVALYNGILRDRVLHRVAYSC